MKQPTGIPVYIVQLMGAAPCSFPIYTPQGIVAGMSEILGKKGSFLNLPLYIQDDYIREIMCKDANNSIILNQGFFADMILTSINDVENIQKKIFG